MIKLIFFDIDGTVLSHTTNSVPASTIEAFKQLQAKGIHVFLSTGRSLHELQKMNLSELSFEGGVTMNGAYCYKGDEILFESHFDSSKMNNLITWSRESRNPLIFKPLNATYTEFHTDPYKQILAELHTPPSPIKEFENEDIYNISICTTPDVVEKGLSTIDFPCEVTWWHSKGCDLTPVGVDKAVGNQKVMESLGITKEETMAFGDSHNDINMLKEAGISIAMGNAMDEVKDVATYTTDHIDEDGVLNALKHFNVL